MMMMMHTVDVAGGRVYHDIIFVNFWVIILFLGHNFVSSLHTLEPEKPEKPKKTFSKDLCFSSTDFDDIFAADCSFR